MKTLKIFLICALILGVASIVYAAETPRIASVSKVEGKVDVKLGKEGWKPAEVGMVLNQGDMIRTQAKSSALLNVDGKAETAVVEVKENSQLKLAELIENKESETQTTLLDLALGEVLIKAQKLHSEKSSFEVKTPTSIVGVRGTTFSVAVEAVE